MNDNEKYNSPGDEIIVILNAQAKTETIDKQSYYVSYLPIFFRKQGAIAFCTSNVIKQSLQIDLHLHCFCFAFAFTLMVKETSRRTTRRNGNAAVPEKPVPNAPKLKANRKDRKAVDKIKKDKKSRKQVDRLKSAKQLRKILLPESVADDYKMRRIVRKMEKYRRLFISGDYDIEMGETGVESDEPELK